MFYSFNFFFLFLLLLSSESWPNFLSTFVLIIKYEGNYNCIFVSRKKQYKYFFEWGEKCGGATTGAPNGIKNLFNL